MTKSSSASARHYDFIVIGAGLSGLAIARRLAMENAKVLVLEGQDNYGGTHHPIRNNDMVQTNGLRLLPEARETREALEFLAPLLGTNLSLSTVESSPLTYESGGLRPFVGFGDQAPPFLHQIAAYLTEYRVLSQPEPWDWCRLLAENGGFELLTKSYVTRFNLNEDKVSSITMNGQKEYTADQYIFTGSATLLKALLPSEVWTAKAKSKLSKLKLWTQVGLDFVHSKPIYEGSNLLLLDGTGKDDLGPCLGRFQIQDGICSSQWMSFLEDDEAEDSEILGQALKKIRRQIKRAFPEAFDDLVFERICVFPSVSANLPTGSFLPKFENLHYGNGQLSPLQGLVGSLHQAQRILAQLGFSSNLSEPVKSSSSDDTEDDFHTVEAGL